MSPPPTGTVTFLFSDIEGSTRLWQEQPDAMRPALARHDAILQECIEAYGGFPVKKTRDGVHAAFADAPQALAAALGVLQTLRGEAWELNTPLKVRLGLHTGPAEQRGGDYDGAVVNQAARLMAAGHGGQALVSAATADAARGQLPDGVSLRDLGERRLKDLASAERVFQLLHPSLSSEFPPLRSLNNPDLPNNLPSPMTSFVGRTAELAAVAGFLETARLVTLTGAGGSGKTRLSLQAAAGVLDRYFDGVWLVELAALSDPNLVPAAVADVLGIKEQPGSALARTLTDFLKPKRLLLVLDNCEHLVDACADLAAALLRACPHVALLASTREPLNVPGEQLYRVPSLSFPPAEAAHTPETLGQYESVSLFADRARSSDPAFAVTSANAGALAQICGTLDGIPLALELAAARVRTLTVNEIQAGLADRFGLLTGGSRTVLPRQQTLRGLIDWSYTLLTPAEKTLLAQMSVFAGGWTRDAAETVGVSATVREGLTSLADKSLVTAETLGEETRYRVLETVRQYGRERLAESGEADAVQQRASAWFLALAEQAEGQLQGPAQGTWFDRLETEHDNLRASLSWYEHQPQGAEDGLRFCGALWRFWYIRGHLSEGLQWSRWFLEDTNRSGTGKRQASVTWGKALVGAGNLAYNQGDYEAARNFHQQCLEIVRRIGDLRGTADAPEGLATLPSSQGQPERGVYLWGASATLREQAGTPLSPPERQKQEPEIARTRLALGEEAFAAAWNAGRAMTLGEAANYALSLGMAGGQP